MLVTSGVHSYPYSPQVPFPMSEGPVHSLAFSALLPSQLRNLRDRRYQGESFDLSVAALSPADQIHVRTLYRFAKGVYGRWIEMRDAPDWEALRASVLSVLRPPLSISMKELGQESMARCGEGEAERALGKVLHDLRGGALMPLQLYAQMAEWDADPIHLRTAAFLARDQAKIMRNALPDLDPEVRRADETEKPHYIQAVVDKWDGFRFEREGHEPGHVRVTCTYGGLLASCCLEASAVDRIVYNYMNNAMRFASGPVISMEIVPIGHHAVRWIVANPVTPEQVDWLEKKTGGDLTCLFRGGVTRGGNGLGLSNCVDFVAAAFGLPDIESALSGKYLGAVVKDGWFLAWAHWPSLYSAEAPQQPGVQPAPRPAP